mmetsp:Transcript_97647/g.315274  ORF Transcript_97647/g.315274 Transcript_97647/m.315274 type:complete len:327 (+) Transcript_97647:256-1236(+)
MAIVLFKQGLARGREDVHQRHNHVLSGPPRSLPCFPRHRSQGWVRVIVANETDMPVKSSDREEVGDCPISYRRLELAALLKGRHHRLDPLVVCLLCCVEHLVFHRHEGVAKAAVRVADLPFDDIVKTVDQLPEGLHQEAAVGKVGRLPKLGVQSLPEVVIHQFLDPRHMRDVFDDACVCFGNDLAQQREILKGRGTVQHVVGPDELVHGLDVHEDRTEGEYGHDAPRRAIRGQRSAHRLREDVACPEVREVEVVHERDASDKRAPPDKLPVLPVLVPPRHDAPVGCLDQHRQALRTEVEVRAKAAEVLPHGKGTEGVQGQPEGQCH